MLTPALLLLGLLACDKALQDGDGDGFATPEDCDDANPDIWPEAPEACDGLDNDCDEAVDEGAARTWYIDQDSDGYGVEPTTACAQTAGLSEVNGDCDDLNAQVYPGAEELCDGLDNDCDSATTEEPPAWYTDADGDGYGDGEPELACEAPLGAVALDGDCDDGDDGLYPGAAEVCDGVDQDCDGEVDEQAPGATRWYRDDDYDTYGAEDSAFWSCEADEPGAVTTGGDCDDRDASVKPGADELCDGVDQDCDGEVDDDALDAPLWYTDADGDGFGDEGSPTTTSCEGASGLSAEPGDCDDGDAAIHPDAEEVCEDGVDNNCDGGAWGCTPGGLTDLDAAAAWIFTGDAAGDSAGYSARPGRGDHDGDGQDDLLLSAPFSGAGQVVLYPGPLSTDGALSSAPVVLTGVGSGDRAGLRLSWVGDCTGDGLDDVLVGAPNNDSAYTDGGAAYLLAGPLSSGSLSAATATISGGARSDNLGISVGSLGDINGDGDTELVVGAYSADTTASDAGAAYVFYGPLRGALDPSDADLTLQGAAKSDRAGGWVGAAGDSEGDGGVDLLVGAYAADANGADSGAVYLVPGESRGTLTLGAVGVRIAGAAAGDYAGFTADGGVDGDGDGYDDLLVGAYGDDQGGSGAGAVCLLSGPFTTDLDLSAASLCVVGDAPGDNAGWALSWVGDLDQDGFPELALGADSATTSGSRAGAAYVWYGPAPTGTWSASDAEAVLWGPNASDRAGSALAGIGDVSGDGYPELLVGAYGTSSSAGAWYVLLGGGL